MKQLWWAVTISTGNVRSSNQCSASLMLWHLQSKGKVSQFSSEGLIRMFWLGEKQIQCMPFSFHCSYSIVLRTLYPDELLVDCLHVSMQVLGKCPSRYQLVLPMSTP